MTFFASLYVTKVKKKKKMLPYTEWTIELKVLFIINMLVIGIGILFHIIGILLIVSKSSEMSNQSILLVHLSVVSLLTLGTNIYAVHHKSFHIFFSHYFIMVYYVAYITYILNLILLTLDRLLMAFVNIRYQSIVTRTKTTVSLIVTWLLAIGYGLMVKYASFYKNRYAFVENESFIYNGFVVCFTALSYTAIAIKIKVSARDVHSTRMVKENSKKYIIPLVIVFSFFLMNLLPPALQKAFPDQLTKTQTQYLTIGLIGVNCLNNLSDAIVYIFLQRTIRKRLMRYTREYICKPCHRYKLFEQESSSSGEPYRRQRVNRRNTSSSNNSSVRGSL